MLAAVSEMNWLPSRRHDQELLKTKGALSDRLFSLLSALHGNMRCAESNSGIRSLLPRTRREQAPVRTIHLRKHFRNNKMEDTVEV